MLNEIFDRFWHKKLHRSYKLHAGIDEGSGQLVVLLHGIGSSSDTWKHIPVLLANQPYRIVAFDLLGFGDSKKPNWPEYTIDDHAKSVIASVESLKGNRDRAVLVGHSMGALIAVRIAKLRPDLVKHLILYEIPIYRGLPPKRSYKLRKDLYFRMYQKIISAPQITNKSENFKKSVKRISGLDLQPETWVPFYKSLKNTVMFYEVLEDMAKLKLPIEVIYGALDLVVIRGKPKAVFEKIVAPLYTHTITNLHSVSLRSSKFIVSRIIVINVTN